MKLYILHKLPTPYNDDFFRALHADEDIDLQVFHLWRGSERRPWKETLGEGYPNFYMSSRFGIDSTSLRAAISDRNSMFMVGDWAHTETIALLLARIARRAPVALWADTPQEHLHRPILKRVPRSIFLKWLLRRVSAIFGSGLPAKRVLGEMGAPPSSIVDLQFLVDLDRPERSRADEKLSARAADLRSQVGCADDGMVLAMAGTIDLAKKAQDLGLRAFADARKRSSEPLGLLIAGAGPQEDELKALAKDLDLSDSVAFLGWQEPSEMDSVYMASDALFHPAHYDPFPLVVLEAMSFSSAIVGSDKCGSVEQRVRSGENGYPFPAGDAEAATEAILKLASDPSHLADCQKSARATAETWPMSRGVGIVKETMKKFLGK